MLGRQRSSSAPLEGRNPENTPPSPGCGIETLSAAKTVSLGMPLSEYGATCATGTLKFMRRQPSTSEMPASNCKSTSNSPREGKRSRYFASPVFSSDSASTTKSFFSGKSSKATLPVSTGTSAPISRTNAFAFMRKRVPSAPTSPTSEKFSRETGASRSFVRAMSRRSEGAPMMP